MARKAAPFKAPPQLPEGDIVPSEAVAESGDFPALSRGVPVKETRVQYAGRLMVLRKGKALTAERALRSFLAAHNIPIDWDE